MKHTVGTYKETFRTNNPKPKVDQGAGALSSCCITKEALTQKHLQNATATSSRLESTLALQ